MIEYSVSDGLSILRLDSPPVNALTFPLLDAIRSSILRANEDDRVAGIVITGDGRRFSAGADVGIFRQIACPQEAVRTSRTFQDAFQTVEDSPKPVAAAVAGNVMGSALELAAACHVRVCGAASRFSMPEVNLGIVPGAGGTGRLPRLIGVASALRMLLTAGAIDARKALELGLVDAVCDERQLVETARALLARVGEPARTSRRDEKVGDASANEGAFAEAAKLLAKFRPEIIAPPEIAEAVRTGLAESFEAGLRVEQQAFARCMDSLAARNRIYLFFATRESGKASVPAGARSPRIAKAAVVGMGSMGAGIAHALVLAGVPVVVRDEDPSALQRGTARIRSSLQRRVEDGKCPPERAEQMFGLLSTTTDWPGIAGADLVIEAVPESASVKRLVIAAAEDVCRPDALIATNTSTISLDVLAEGMRRPQRLIGLHFFNPAHRMPLVEVIRRDATDQAAVAAAMDFAKSIRKTPVLVKNREGFLVNRIFVPYLKEAFWLLEDGAEAEAVDRAMVEFGLPMGPLALIDMAGLDILVDVDKVMSRAFPAHGQVSAIAVRLVEAGRLGQKTGSGVYRYEPGDHTPRPDEEAVRTIAEVRRRRDRPACAGGAEAIARRLVMRMVGEAFRVLEEGIARRESDVDVAMVLGAGFPDFRGGPLKYARDLGLSGVVAQLDELAASFGERFAPCRLLREMKGT